VIVAGVGCDGTSNRSEFRHWTDQDDQPIEQTTTFDRIPINLSAKLYLLSRGRSLAKHAWVPSNFTPYVTAGGGVMIYNLTQEGDWIDYQTLIVFSRRFTSTGAGG